VKCEIENASFLKCTITNTEGFPISDKCFNDRDVKICLHQYPKNYTDCYNFLTNSKEIVQFYNNKYMTSVIIPATLFNTLAYEFASYTPQTDIWNFNFSITFNHTKYIPVGSSKYM
jgi:hypothetical protein